MTIHRIRMLGDPVLRTRCEPIAKPGSTAVRMIVDDLRETLRDFQSRFGHGAGRPRCRIQLEGTVIWPQ